MYFKELITLHLKVEIVQILNLLKVFYKNINNNSKN